MRKKLGGWQLENKAWGPFFQGFVGSMRAERAGAALKTKSRYRQVVHDLFIREISQDKKIGGSEFYGCPEDMIRCSTSAMASA